MVNGPERKKSPRIAPRASKLRVKKRLRAHLTELLEAETARKNRTEQHESARKRRRVGAATRERERDHARVGCAGLGNTIDGQMVSPGRQIGNALENVAEREAVHSEGAGSRNNGVRGVRQDR